MSRARLVVIVWMGVAIMAGCMTPAQNRRDALVRVSREYNDGLRWGRYQDVTPHLAVDEAQRFLARTQGLADDFEMADDEIASITFSDGGLHAAVTVDFTWYNLRRSLLRKTQVAQDWRFVNGRWICAAQRRVRGDRFPLIPEPLAQAPAPAEN